MTTDHRGQAYEYDAENRLNKVFASAGGAQIAGYFYNADGTCRYSNEQTQQHAYYDGD